VLLTTLLCGLWAEFTKRMSDGIWKLKRFLDGIKFLHNWQVYHKKCNSN
jgi:hypothetical protein